MTTRAVGCGVSACLALLGTAVTDLRLQPPQCHPRVRPRSRPTGDAITGGRDHYPRVYEINRNTGLQNQSPNGLIGVEGRRAKHNVANAECLDPDAAVWPRVIDPEGAVNAGRYKRCGRTPDDSADAYRCGNCPFRVVCPFHRVRFTTIARGSKEVLGSLACYEGQSIRCQPEARNSTRSANSSTADPDGPTPAIAGTALARITTVPAGSTMSF